VLTAIVQNAAPEPGAGEMLVALLGVQSLLLAAVGISVSLAASSGLGNKWKVSPATFAFLNTGVLALLTVGSGVLWAHLFAGSAWPPGSELRVGALALALAILAPPLVSLVLAINLKWK
jgi:hypothetical protein